MILFLLTACHFGTKGTGDSGPIGKDGDDTAIEVIDTDTDTDTDSDTDADTCNTDNEDCGPRTCDGEGGRMLPGSDCLACHSQGSGAGEEDEPAPIWTIAGTAFADADGTRPLADAVIHITDANGQPHELTTNSVGNFYTDERVPMPYTAEIEVGGETKSMSADQEYGGCNSCHACEGAAGGKLHGP